MNPDDISCQDQVFDISFHPTMSVLSAGLITGAIELHKYSLESDSSDLLLSLSHHTSSCRGLQFSPDGLLLYSISSDMSMCTIDQSGQVIMSYKNAHSSPINKLCHISPNIIATGDDSGCVRIWDTRVSEHTMNFHLHEDFVSGFNYYDENQTLLSVSGDATLCAYDLRKQDSTARSEDQEAELHCVVIIKNGKKVICSTQEGVLLTFSWGRWGDCSDRFPGHPETIDSVLKVDESTLITGSGDGLIRIVSIHPNKMLGVLGDHDEFPVEGMDRSFDNKLLGSFAHDELIRFWDTSMLIDDDGGEDEDDDNVDVEEEGMDGVEESKGNSGEEEDVDDAEETAKDVVNMEEEETSAMSEQGTDSSDDEIVTTSKKPFHRPSKNESFFADL